MHLGIIKCFLLQIATNVRLAQLDRAFGYGPKGRGFESSSARWLENAEALINTVFPLFFCKQNKGFLHTLTYLFAKR